MAANKNFISPKIYDPNDKRMDLTSFLSVNIANNARSNGCIERFSMAISWNRDRMCNVRQQRLSNAMRFIAYKYRTTLHEVFLVNIHTIEQSPVNSHRISY